MDEISSERCPVCSMPVGSAAFCPSCGIEFAGQDARELRALAADLASAEADLQVVWSRRNELAKQHSERQWAIGLGGRPAPKPLRGWQPPAVSTRAWRQGNAPSAPRPNGSSGEWTVDRVRNLLLWAGATLLALSALAFTAVAWSHLGPGGRASLLVVFTFIAAAGAIAVRDRLPATSGALTGLAIALALIDWQIVRRAGVAPGLSGSAWWAFGTAVVGVASFALGRVASRAIASRAVALLLPLSAVLGIAAGASHSWNAALGLSLLAAALTAATALGRDRIADPFLAGLLRLEAVTSWIVGAFVAVDAAFAATTFAHAMAPAAVMTTFAIAPAFVLAFGADRARDRTWSASLVLASGAGAILTLVSTSVGPAGLATLAVVLGTAAIAAGVRANALWRRAAHWTGAVAIAPGVVFAGCLGLIAEAGPLAWLSHAWTGSTGASALSVVTGPESTGAGDFGWCALAIMLSAAVAAAIVLRSLDDQPQPDFTRVWWFVPAGMLLVAGAMAPLVAGASVGITCAVVTLMVVAVVLAAPVVAHDDVDRAPLYVSLAVLPAVPAVGWAATTAGASIIVLLVVGVAATFAAATTRVAFLRAANAALAALAAVGLAAVIALAAGAAPSSAGCAAAVVAGLVLVAAVQLRRDTVEGIALEVVGVVGMIAGALLAAQAPVALALTLTAFVPVLVAAGSRGERRRVYEIAAAGAALAATWAWLYAAGVTVVEAYTLPAAAAALGCGVLARRDGPSQSWLTLGPALVLALAPTLNLALANNDDGRAIAVGLAALAIVIAGAARRLQAPIVLGTAALVILGVEKLGPTAVQLPRWLVLAFAGSVLLWIGTTFERRRDDALRALRRFEQLG